MKRIKRIIAAASAAVIAASSFSVIGANAAGFQFRGDVNNDGYVNDADAQALIDFVLGRQTKGLTRQSSDLNKDGTVNIFDVIIERRILAGYDKSTMFIRNHNKEFHPGDHFLETGTHYGILQEDGNAVIYRKSDKHVSFNTGTCFGDDYKDYKLIFQADGNIVIYATPNYPGASQRPIWDAGKGHRYAETNHPYQISLDGNGNMIWNDEFGNTWNSAYSQRKATPISNNERRLVAENRMRTGYLYSNPDTAAIDFIFYFNPISTHDYCEYDAAINRVIVNGVVKYRIGIDMNDIAHYRGEPRTGYDGTGAPIDFIDGETAAYVHTHGQEACIQNNWFSVEDLDLANRHHCDAYVGAPNGTIRKYIHDTPFSRDRNQQGNLGFIIYRGAPK